MFTRKNAVHAHDYTRLGFIREVGATDTKVVNRIILTRTCDCGASQAFECGTKDIMRKLYVGLAYEHKDIVF